MATDWEARARTQIGREFAPVLACDPVNAPMIRHWCEAMGHPFEWNEVLEAPATMLQCWLSPGPTRARPPGSASADASCVLELLRQGGYPMVVTVNSDWEFERPLHPGDELNYVSVFESISEEKRTGLGTGRFLGFRWTVRDARGDMVGTLRFTQLAYRP